MNKKGGNLVEYILPVALIGVALGMSIYYMSDSGILKGFFQHSSGGNIKGRTLILNEVKAVPFLTTMPGCLGGSRNDPKMKCTDGKCVIDFGDYILKGVPEGITDVSSAGRGGDLTETYASLLMQLANQIKEKDPAQSNILERLAEQARLMAGIEKADSQNAVTTNKYLEQAWKTGNLSGILADIKPAKLNPDDPYKIVAIADYLCDIPRKANDVYKTDREASLDAKKQFVWYDQKRDLTYASMIISKSYPRLEPWQSKFLNDMSKAKTSAEIRVIADNIKPYITDSVCDQLFLDSQMRDFLLHDMTQPYGAGDRSYTQFDSIKRTGKGPGKEFNNILTKEVPKAKLSPELLKVVNIFAKEVQTVGDYTADQLDTLGPNSTFKQNYLLDLHPTGQNIINKSPAASIIDAIKKIAKK